MASPSMTTGNSAGNLLTSTTIAASASTTFNVDLSAKFEGQVQVGVTFGTVAATAGLQVQVFRRVGSGPAVDTAAVTQFVIAAVASTTSLQSFALPTGRYQVKLTNLDATNSVTSVSATDDTIDAVS
jgi:hypothetical protein